MGLLGTHLYPITSATVSPRATEPDTDVVELLQESLYFDLENSPIDNDAKSSRNIEVFIIINVSAENFGKKNSS